MIHRFSAPLWKWKGDSAWHFVTLPFEDADDIDASTAHVQRGFGSVRVRVTVGGSTWTTSVFPSNEHRSYLLPVKAAVRAKERLQVGEPVPVTLEVLDADGTSPGGPAADGREVSRARRPRRTSGPSPRPPAAP